MKKAEWDYKMTDNENPVKDYAVVVAYGCRLGDKGTVVSVHATRKLAERKAKRSGFDSFLKIEERD